MIAIAAVIACPMIGSGQEPQPARTDVHEHVAVTAPLLTPPNETSGTAWLPQATPMYGVHRPFRGWDVRLNGVAFVQALFEPRARHRTGGSDTSQVGGVNWGMFMARRNAGGGRVGIRTMFSAEPWTVPGCGSLSFLATGEVCEGDTVHDRQQQHDLVMELAFDYEHPIQGAWRWQVYAGLAGEPALGPPGFPHRASAAPSPIGPVTHHWLDSPVAFGVLTLGVHNQRWKIEASVFNGREPDEGRTDLDFGAVDSVAARLSFLPTERVALQMSAAPARGVDRLPVPVAGSRHPAYSVRGLSPTSVRERDLGNDCGLRGESRTRESTARYPGCNDCCRPARKQPDGVGAAHAFRPRRGRQDASAPLTRARVFDVSVRDRQGADRLCQTPSHGVRGAARHWRHSRAQSCAPRAGTKVFGAGRPKLRRILQSAGGQTSNVGNGTAALPRWRGCAPPCKCDPILTKNRPDRRWTARFCDCGGSR